jgi:PilZ domain
MKRRSSWIASTAWAISTSFRAATSKSAKRLASTYFMAGLYRSLKISKYQCIMERRAVPRNPVLMSGAIEFAGRTMNCLVRNISISGAALDVSNPNDIPERFNLVFKADGTAIPCHVIWRQEERIGVAFD